VVAVGEDLAVLTHQAVERSGRTDGETLHRAGKGALIGELDDEMGVIALQAEVGDAASESLPSSVETAS
jgi:hypothetical protein